MKTLIFALTISLFSQAYAADCSNEWLGDMYKCDAEAVVAINSKSTAEFQKLSTVFKGVYLTRQACWLELDKAAIDLKFENRDSMLQAWADGKIRSEDSRKFILTLSRAIGANMILDQISACTKAMAKAIQ